MSVLSFWVIQNMIETTQELEDSIRFDLKHTRQVGKERPGSNKKPSPPSTLSTNPPEKPTTNGPNTGNKPNAENGPNTGNGPNSENRPLSPAERLPEDSIYSIKIPYARGYDPENEDAENRKRRDTVKEAFKFAFEGYRDHCMGEGELKPESGTCHNWLGGNLGLTIIDSLDTMLIMGLDELYKESRDWIFNNLDFNKNIFVSVFEINIRCLGGLLTAYDLTKDDLMLKKAQELADHLLPAFNTPTGIPLGHLELNSGRTKAASWTGGSAILSEMGSLQLEFAYLSQATGKPIYAKKALNILKELYRIKPADSLYPVYINPNNRGMSGPITAGALGDSFYEYLLKYWLLAKKSSSTMKNWYYHSADNIISGLSRKTNNGMLIVTDKAHAHSTSQEMEHLTCFVGGMFALGAMHAEDEQIQKAHGEAGAGVAKACHEMYAAHATGLHGENARIEGDKVFVANAQFLMRPESIETWFYMWRLTKDQKYRDWAWGYMESLNKYSKRRYGYAGLRNANAKNPEHDDVQQSWFLAETLKYLYLIFAPDDVMPLDKFVFNTEAHAFTPFEPNYNIVDPTTD